MIAFMLILAASGCVILGLLVLSRGWHSPLNLLAASINACVAIWSLGILLFLQTSDPTVALVSAKGYYIASALFVALLTIFAMVFPAGQRSSRKYTLLIALVATAMFSLLLIPSFVTTSIILRPGGHNFIRVEALSYVAFCTYFVVFFSVGFTIMVKKFFAYKHKARAQAGSFIIGLIAMSAPGFVTNLYLPLFGVYDYIWVGPAAASIFVASVTYGIVRHGMFDIRLASVRTLAYVLSLGTLASIYYVLVYAVSSILFSTQSTLIEQSPISIGLALILSFLFQPIRRFFNQVTNRIFYRDNYDSGDFYALLNRTLTSTTDLHLLLKRAATDIASTLKTEQAFFVVHRQPGHHASSGTVRHNHLPIADIRYLDACVQKWGDGEIIASLLSQSNKTRRLMVSHHIELILPLVLSDTIIGYLCLGEQQGSGFSHRDINVLQTISDELVIAIQNALSIQEVRELNATLQQRINEATHELRASNAQLHRLDEAKDEFVGMASHQLRTPLTSVKGYISMVIEGDAGKITDAQKHLLEEAFTSSERMVHLINDFLNVSRLQTGKFMIDKRPTNLAKVVEQELDSLTTTAASRNLSFSYKPPKGFPMLDLDEGKIRQVIMNFADNALYYSAENTTIHVKLTSENGVVSFSVKDTGIGVPLTEQAELFTKFYRASNARKQRPDGTGVGLFLAKKVIDAHGGKVVFESVEGQGSTFGFHLPLEKLRPVDHAN